jgi:prepilin-type N-terminal cleavage/methylation domain-containing protein
VQSDLQFKRVEGDFTMLVRRAFTLIELLVVIGIIAILISVLLPVLSAARDRATNLQCLSNLRACGQILHIYAQQNRGFFPPMNLQSPEALPRGLVINEGGIQVYYPNVREALARILNPKRDPVVDDPNFSPGGLKIFYCPANFFWDGDAPGVGGAGLSHWPEDFMSSRGRIKYWYFGNPNPFYPQYHFQGPFGGDPALPASPPMTAPSGYLDWRFWDTNRSGDNRDEYIIKNNDSKPSLKLLMTDQSRQKGSGGSQFGFQFVHGPRRSPLQGWKNNLYGDGHAESKFPRKSSFSADGTTFINPTPGQDEVQPRWGRADVYQMW